VGDYGPLTDVDRVDLWFPADPRAEGVPWMSLDLAGPDITVLHLGGSDRRYLQRLESLIEEWRGRHGDPDLRLLPLDPPG
jgi:hypothetical protein